jgi:hypothetical protein
MIRKTILLLLTLLAGGIGYAQHAVGEWTIYANFDSSMSDIVETPSKVYYLSSNTLYSYDTDDCETYQYTSKKLSDNSIQNIYYNKDNKYLFIVYEDSNIDLLYENGKVVNLPDLMDTNIVNDKTINDVAFANNRIYLATAFGMLVFDDQRHEVVESGIYNISATSVAVMDGKILLYAGGKLYSADASLRHNTIDKFTQISGVSLTKMHVTGSNEMFTVNNNALYKTTVDFTNGKAAATSLGVTVKGGFKECKDGFYVRTASSVLIYNEQGELQSTVAIPSDLTSNEVATWTGADSMWFGNGDGIACYNVSTTTPTLYNERYRPEAFTCKKAVFITVSKDGNRFYFSNLGPSKYVSATNYNEGYDIPQKADKLENGIITDVAIKEATGITGGMCATYQKRAGDTRMYGGVTRMVEDANIPNRYYVGSGADGLFVVQDGVQIHRFDYTNSPLVQSWICRVHDVNIDKEGNLWVGQWYSRSDSEYSPYFIIPASKLKGDVTEITKDDWAYSNFPESETGSRDMGSVFCSKSNMAFFWNGDYEHGIVAYDTNGTYTNGNDDKSVLLSSFTDQDGNSFSATRYICGAEDAKGRVWIGTTSGLFEITTHSTALNSDFRINRLKVPRNDGTNYADYLLESEQINGISVDASNRKWIATEVSGVYLVSADGDEIIEHFDTSNSYLPSNTVYSVCCDPYSNVVYIGTSLGVVSYNSSSSPASEDFSNVYAFPNPVRPDYTGWITVTGLMDNSLVKIADAAGNVFYQGTSEGGMVTWDGCNAAGERVKTGVYYVFASKADDTKTTGVVTKIMVIK